MDESNLIISMGYFYIDESIHKDAEFIIGACLYSHTDLNDKVSNVISECGFDPTHFEYKSSTNYSKEPEKASVREQLKQQLLNDCKLGVVVLPLNKREELGFECIKALHQFIQHNHKRIKLPLSIYFDQGMFHSVNKAMELITKLEFKDTTFHLEQNSISIKGIQIADLVAHTSSIQLKDHFGLVNKKVPQTDYDYDIELGLEMFATIRYLFFNRGTTKYTGDQIKDATVDVEPFGLYISNLCDTLLAETARQAFGTVYLGCMH